MIFKTGDVTEATENFIAHGCNCQGVMGSGVAKVIKQKFPLAYEYYHNVVKYYGDRKEELLGSYCSVMVGDKIILNLFTQKNYGTDKRHMNYAAILSSFEKVYEDFGKCQIAIPLIGAGLGGGNWEVIEMLLKDFEEKTGIEFVVYTLD